jgi:hypothetical protein
MGAGNGATALAGLLFAAQVVILNIPEMVIAL